MMKMDSKNCEDKKLTVFEEMYPKMMEDIKKGIQKQFEGFEEKKDGVLS